MVNVCAHVDGFIPQQIFASLKLVANSHTWKPETIQLNRIDI